jgi:hypothetical protein
MADRAKILNSQVLKDIKAGLIDFSDSVNQTLASVDS